MHVQVPRNRLVDRVEEASEFERPMSRVTLADDRSRFDVQRGEERRRPVADVVVRPPFDLPGPQRQHRRAAIQRLDLRLFIDTQDQGAIRWRQIQADDIAHLVDEERVLRELERLDAVGLQRKRLSRSARPPIG